MSGYLIPQDVESLLAALHTSYPAFTELITLPNQTHQGRTVRAIRIGNGSSPTRHGVLMLGGVHGNELINPDLVLGFAYDLAEAYATNSSLSYGPSTYSASSVQLLVDVLDIFIVPLVNPDGRHANMNGGGTYTGRHNSNPNGGSPFPGVDINRNFGFVWWTGIGAATTVGDLTFHGTSAFSEPEGRNVQWLLDDRPGISCMLDIHSYSELILYPWGHETTQTTDPSMNFTNPIYRPAIGGSDYEEYMQASDRISFINASERMRDAIALHRGRSYTVKSSVGLYPTSGTTVDYAFSRHISDATKKKVNALVVETGTSFQPVYAEAEEVMEEVSLGLVEFLLNCICPVEAVNALLDSSALSSGRPRPKPLPSGGLSLLRAFRDKVMMRSSAGRRYVQTLGKHRGELNALLTRKPALALRAAALLPRLISVVRKRKEPRGSVVSAALVKKIDALMKAVGKAGTEGLRRDVDALRTRDLPHFIGVTVTDGLKSASRRVKKPRRR